MMNLKKQLFALALAISIGFAAFALADWADPAGTPPANNIDAPITVLPNDQIKNGNLSVGGFGAFGAASFAQQVFFPAGVRGEVADPNDATGVSGVSAPLQIGGVDAAGTQRKVDLTATGNFKTTGTIGAQELSTTGDKEFLCGDHYGHIVFCPLPPVMSVDEQDLWVQIAGNMNDTVTITVIDENTGDTKTIHVPQDTPADQGGQDTKIYSNVFTDGHRYTVQVDFTSYGRPRGAPGVLYDDYGVINQSCGECNHIEVSGYQYTGNFNGSQTGGNVVHFEEQI